MRSDRRSLSVLALSLLTACYDAGFNDCAIRCTEATGCPEGFSCGGEGLCRSDDGLCSEILGDAMTPDGPYTQAECAYKEPNDSIATAAMLVAADTGPAAICQDDRDFYRLVVMSATVTVAIQFSNLTGGDLDLKLYDSGGTLVSQSRGLGGGETLTCPGATPACGALTVGQVFVFEVLPAVTGEANAYTITLEP